MPPNTKMTDQNDAQTPEPRSSTAQSSSSRTNFSGIAHTSPGSATAGGDSPVIQQPSQPTTSMPKIATEVAQDGEKDTKYVLLGVKTGEYLHLAQISVQNYRDDQFFHELRVRYNELRGVLSRYFSIWGYSHCDFIKVFRILPQ
jgi:hypothetical protein